MILKLTGDIMKNIIEIEKINKLRNYYENRKLLILGLGDYLGSDILSFFRSDLSHELVSFFNNSRISLDTINLPYLMVNKPEYIDYFIKNNLSIEEIKLIQVYTSISNLGNIGNISRLTYNSKAEDRKIRLAYAIRDAYEPIIIYSRKIINDNIENTIKSIAKNYETILGLNSTSDIYTIGLKSISLNEQINYYNKELERISNEYGVTFINPNNINSSLIFYILNSLYNKKIIHNPHLTFRYNEYEFTDISDLGIMGIIEDIKKEHNKRVKTLNITGIPLDKEKESYLKEEAIFQRVLYKTKKIKYQIER